MIDVNNIRDIFQKYSAVYDEKNYSYFIFFNDGDWKQPKS